MHYTTVFEVASSGYRAWDGPAVGGALTVISTGVLVVRHRLGKPLRGKDWFGAVFTLLWTCVAFRATYSEYASLRDTPPATIEGVVSRFREDPKSEQFCVDADCFKYSEYTATSAFNQTRHAGGPIRDGLPVRIAHVGGQIVKLEVGTE